MAEILGMNHERHETHEKLLYSEEVYAIQGAIFDVYKELAVATSKRFIRSVWKKNFI